MPTISQGKIAKIYFNGHKGSLFAADQLAQDMERLINEAVAEASRLCAGQRPGFDFRQHPVMRQKLEEITGRLRQQMESAIEQGSKDAWLRAETTTSKVVEAMALGNPKLADLLSAGLNVKQNDRALEAFQGRVINGMRLSDRVWNLTAQTQAQIEQGIEVALAEGTPAAKLSRQVRNCLQNPDNFFRRFKYKVKDEPLFDERGLPILDSTGKQTTRPVYGRKWKRRYVDADGNTRWQDVNLDDYRYGRGVYRSAYKNAMRLARTEVNMAYQASDHERWKRSWWVKGIRVGLSNNHPVDDICNDLAGDYPADFKFVGWHPQCRCFAHAITATSEEIQEYYRRKRAGEDMSEYEVPGKVKEIPEGAKKWLSANQPRLLEAKANGTVPYFVSDNAKYTGAQFAPKTKQPGATVIAAKGQTEHVPLKTINIPGGSSLEQLSEEEKIATVQRMTGVDEATARGYAEAIRDYSHGWDYEIREYQRAGNVASLKPGHSIEEVRAKAATIEEFIAKSPQWTQVSYRGMGVSEEAYQAMLADAKSGTLSMGGASSWSSELADARAFAIDQRWTGERLVVLETTNGGRATSIRHLSAHPDENEVLHSATNRYRIVGEPIEEKRGRYRITRIKVEAIPESEIKKPSIQERAAARHAARTEEDIERIQLAWDAHRRDEYERRMLDELMPEARDKIKTDLYDVDCGMFGDHDSNRRILDEMRRKLDTHKSNLNLWNDLVTTTPNKRKDVIPDFGKLDMFSDKTSITLRAAKRHAARTDKEIVSINKAWNNHRIEDAKRILAGKPTPEQALKAKLKISDATIRNFDKAKEITDYLTKQYPGIGIHMDGMDIETIRQSALSADSHFVRFPALTSKFKQLGSIGWQYDEIVQKELDKRVADRIAMHNSSKAVLTGRKAPIKDLDKATKDKIRATIESEKSFISRSPAGNKSTYAFSDPWSKYDTNGIYWNESRTFKKATDSVKKDVASKFHPEGCDSIRAIFDHEFGHKVDEYLGLRTKVDFIKIYDAAVAKGETWVKDNLSHYAWKGADPKAEFIAEAWSEYVCSAKPRPIAKKIGELIEKLAAAKTP